MRPYMQNKDIIALEDLIRKAKPEIVLEFGSGGSTTHFPTKFNQISHWYSVEHDEEWQAKVDLLAPSNVILVKALEENYLENRVVEEVIPLADLIIVDGIKRKECLEMAFKLSRRDALTVLHDSCRKDYKDFFKIFPFTHKLTNGRDNNKRDGFHVFGKTSLSNILS